MKKRFSICFFILVSVSIYSQRTVLISNVNIVDVQREVVLKDMHVLIKDSVIVEIINDKQKKSSTVADTVINGKSKYLIPGMWDMHTHVFAPDQMFPLLVANGVTGIRDMFDNIVNVNQWRNRMRTGSLLNIDLFVSGPIVDGPRPIWPGSAAVGNAEQGRRVVDSVKNILKADFVKVYSLLSRESYFAIAAEAKKQNIPFAGHVPNVITATEAAKSDQKSQEHLTGLIESAGDSSDFYFQYQQGKLTDTTLRNREYRRKFLLSNYNPEKLRSLLKEIKATDTWMSPTLTVNYGIAHMDDTTLLYSSRMQYMGEYYKSFWDYRKDFRFRTYTAATFALSKKEFDIKLKIVKAIHEAGIPSSQALTFPILIVTRALVCTMSCNYM